MNGKIESAIEDFRKEVAKLQKEFEALEYVLAIIVTNLKNQHHKQDFASILLDWYESEGVEIINKSRI